MFNAPRPNRNYGASSTNGFGASFVAENPLISSVYDDGGLDPWSSAPSPAPPTLPTFPSTSSSFSAVIGDATVPPIYNDAFAAVDQVNAGEISVNALSRVLGSTSLPASTIDKIVSLVSNRPRVSKLEFVVALALAALAQSGKDVSVERVAALAQENALPVPSVDLAQLGTSISGFTQFGDMTRSTPTRTFTTEDPWSIPQPKAPIPIRPETNGVASLLNGAPSSISGTGLPREWWKKQETVYVNVLGKQGFLLNQYLVYEISTDRGAPVPRRYSEFVFLWDCLVKRYPFRLLPSLPPKRIQPDEGFLEQRRKGLARFLNFVINHPIIKEDGVLQVFLTEPSLEAWRKHTSVSYDEESVSKRVDQVEEMTIPADLEDKLAIVRGKIGYLVEHWQRICLLAERIVRRREAEAVRASPALRRAFLPAHFAFSPFSLAARSSAFPASSSSSSATDPESMASSIFGNFGTNSVHGVGSILGLGGDVDGAENRGVVDEQADLSRLTNTVKSLVEVNERCWRGDECDLCVGVRDGLVQVSVHTQKQADVLEHRSRALQYSTLEALKSQRDLYIAMRDLFIRRDRLSGDKVEILKKNVERNSQKLEVVRQVRKEGWETEADRITGLVEKDQAAITAQMNRRVFIRACLWHELRVVLHNRENALLTGAVQQFAREEHDFSETISANWASMEEAVSGMPFE